VLVQCELLYKRTDSVLKFSFYAVHYSVQSDLSELRIANIGLQMSLQGRINRSWLFRYTHAAEWM